MLNPVLRDTKSRLFYVLIWVIIMMAHSFFIHYYYDFPLWLSIIDSLIHNICYLFFGIVIWYIVRYNDFEIKKLINLVSGHIVSAVIIISIWLGIAGLLTKMVIKNENYLFITNQFIAARFILGILFYIVIVLVYYLFIYYQNFKEKIQHEATIEAKYKEAELNTLRSQINPHFIFNSLNSISSLTITDPVKAQEMIVKLSDFFRLTLKNNSRQLTTLTNELNFTKLYFEIEKVRFGDKLEFFVDLEDTVGNTEVPHLILQPLLENAIKHGLQESMDMVNVSLKCIKSDEYIILILSNRFDQDIKVKGEGIGLKNVRERLRLIYGMSDLLTTYIENGEFVAKIKIPLKIK